MKQLSREHQAVFNFEQAAIQLRPVTETDEGQEDYRDFFDYFTGSISNFINSELHFRQAERCTNVGVQPDLESYSQNFGEELNNRGIELLQESLTSFNSFKDVQGELPATDSEFQQELNTFKHRLKETMVTLEIKGSDAEELSNQIDELANTLASGSTGMNLLDYGSTKIQELIDTRNQPGRGADSNIPLWKLIAAAVLLLLGTWVVYKCYYTRRLCSKKQKAIYNTILAVAMIVFGACE